ncbi:MAG: deoxyribonuclease IV [Desulfuromonadaceae bacterium]|nr:deoxyribonuclease IV [Desulfuromonadaceae bacterium]
MQPLGAHMSISGGLHNAFAHAAAAGCSALQIFTKNANRWAGKAISDQDAAQFKAAWKASEVGPVVAHDSYLINLAAPDDAKWEQAKAAFSDELERCQLLGVPALVMHPGAHLESGVATGIERVCAAFREIFANAPPVTVLLETTAGQGSYLGARFEELAAIIAGVPGGNFGICFDTCHVFAAGYDISTAAGYAATLTEFDRIVGCDKIAAFHLNDSQKGCGSRVDRHAHIGAGAIGLEGFRALMRDERFARIPKILETPKGDDGEMDVKNLALLRELAGE